MSQNEKPSVTIRDVAKVANVSTATVSHVLNNTRFVAQKTKTMVQDAVKQTGYQPNMAARRLRGGDSGILGMLVPNSSNPFFAETVKAFEAYCAGQGYSVLLVNCDRGDAQQKESVRTLSAHGVDGIAVLLTNPQIEYIRLIMKESSAPVLSLDIRLSQNCLVVKDNSTKGGEMAARHIWDTGRRNIAILAGPEHHQRMHERLAGVQNFLRSKAAPVPQDRIVNGPLNFEGGAAAAQQLFEATIPSNRPDALICFNDAMAIGALKSIHDLDVKVPQDVSVIGYDNIALGNYTIPGLTTVSQDGSRLGRRAAEALIRRIQNNNTSESEIIIEPKLIVRESA